MRKSILLLVLSILLCFSINAQSTGDKLKIFLDCGQTWLCDFDFVRTEMTMVDFVRDRAVSDVHVMVNTQSSSSGGVQATLYFLGLGRFAGSTDTLQYFNELTSTDDQQRKKMVHYLKLGLTRYVAKTRVADHINISYSGTPATENEAANPIADKWNNWIFSLGVNGNINGNSNERSRDFYGSFSADRETAEWKINADVSLENDFWIVKEDSTESRFDEKEYYGNLQIAKAINSHWSYGLSASYENRLFSNILAGYRLRPKLEYSVFPYSQFNTQRIVFRYMVGPSYSKYYDSTIYYKITEWQVQQSLNAIGTFTKPWGELNLGISFNNYLSDFKKNSLRFNAAVNWNIAKGLRFSLWGNYSFIHDQITLRKGNATRDQILVRNRQLKSSYQYYLGVGFNYSFGSIMNSIVNPRFR